MPDSKNSQLAQLLDQLASYPAVQGCALVEIETGMVWKHAGQWQQVESFAESAVEVWRVQLRNQAHLAHLGSPRSSICYFANGSMALLPCPGVVPVLLVCIADRAGMNWAGWMGQLKPLLEILSKA